MSQYGNYKGYLGESKFQRRLDEAQKQREERTLTAEERIERHKERQREAKEELFEKTMEALKEAQRKPQPPKPPKPPAGRTIQEGTNQEHTIWTLIGWFLNKILNIKFTWK